MSYKEENKSEYAVEVLSVFPDTQLLIFRFTEENQDPEKLLLFQEKMESIFGHNPRLKIFVTDEDFEISIVDYEHNVEINVTEKETKEDILKECMSLSLGVELKDFPLERLSDAVRAEDRESLKSIREELRSKILREGCPLCGAVSV